MVKLSNKYRRHRTLRLKKGGYISRYQRNKTYKKTKTKTRRKTKSTR